MGGHVCTPPCSGLPLSVLVLAPVNVCGMSIRAESANGAIEFVGNGVIIKSKGGTKVVPLDKIQGAEFKKAGLTAGYIRLSVAGSVDMSVRTKMKNEQLSKDPNAVLFSRAKLNDDFEAVADAINEAMLTRSV